MVSQAKGGCKVCKSMFHTKFSCPQVPRKAIKQKGKRTIEYEKWRDTIARPYLIKTFGPQCADCKGLRCNNLNLDVDHKKNRGSHPHLRMTLSNVQLLGRFPCHVEKTEGKT